MGLATRPRAALLVGQPISEPFMYRDRPSIADKYALGACIGTGGMAEVYRAEEWLTGRLVAIKRIMPHLLDNREFVDMFLDEQRVACALSHPNICEVLDVGGDGDERYIAMELIEGATLHKLVQEHPAPWPLSRTAYIIEQVLAGLEHAHAATDEYGQPLRLVHRNIMPKNIMLSRRGEVKIIDFGIAKATGRLTVTPPGVIKGVVEYMAPEQARGDHVDHRADLFAVGVILYELATGTRPFAASNVMDSLRRIMQGQLTPPRQINSAISRDLALVIGRALAVDPDERYLYASELRHALLSAVPEPDSALACSLDLFE